MRLALALLAVVLRPPLTAPTSPEVERRIALVIRNAAYQGANPLANPVNDARAIAAKLKALNFEVISVENGGRPPMTIALSRVRSRAARRCRAKPNSS